MATRPLTALPAAFFLVSVLIFTFALTLPATVFAAAKASPKSAPPKKGSPMTEQEKTHIQELFSAFKKALAKPDLAKLETLSAGETHEMITAAKSGDAETKSFLTGHFKELGTALSAGTFDAPVAVNDTVSFKGKHGATRLEVDFVKEKGDWKVVNAMVDDSEATAQELSEKH